MQARYRASLSKEDLTDPSRRPATKPISRNEVKLHELVVFSFVPLARALHRWWLERAERHYLMCADIEQQRAREAQMNVAYYQKRAALARSAQL